MTGRRANAPGGMMGLGALAMAGIVTLSNYLVQFPLGDYLTLGAFSYPFAFLVTDLVNRTLGPAAARRVVYVGFAVAVLCSMLAASVRIAIASGVAFMLAQLFDVTSFHLMRRGLWWRAPLVSSLAGGLLDTALFFSLAFAAPFAILGASDPLALETAPLMGHSDALAPRWVSWGAGDYGVKIACALVALVPFRLLMPRGARTV